MGGVAAAIVLPDGPGARGGVWSAVHFPQDVVQPGRLHPETPLQWLLHQRVDRAREILETTDLPLEQVARQSGFGTADSLRHHLVQRVGVTPSTYRTAYARPSYDH